MTTVECFCGMALSYVCDGDLGALLDWRHSYLIPLVTISNWWLSSKDMKLRVLIKEVLVVFHWLTFRIILLCSLASGHRALFLLQETTQELYIYIYIYIYICVIHIIHKYINIHIYICLVGIFFYCFFVYGVFQYCFLWIWLIDPAF